MTRAAVHTHHLSRRLQIVLKDGDPERIKHALPSTLTKLKQLHQLANAAGARLREPDRKLDADLRKACFVSVLTDWDELASWLQLRCFEAIGRLFSFAILNEVRTCDAAPRWTNCSRPKGAKRHLCYTGAVAVVTVVVEWPNHYA